MAQSKDAFTLPKEWSEAMQYRSIGPAGMGGRVTSIAVNPQDYSNYIIGMAHAGLVMTKNNGVTFEHLFTSESACSVGDVEISASDPNIIWVGTGENNPRNSVSYGNGVYKSVDGGKTWTHMGLPESFQIGKILIHPKNPNIVYVGALGRLWGPNEQRGLFKTTDGGKTWSKVLYINSNTGVIDARMDPRNPDVIYATTWERRRGLYDAMEGKPDLPEGYDAYDPIVKWGAGSGLWKSTDGGSTWKKLTKGLPTGKLGRIGIDIWQKNPNVLFAIVDCDQIGMGPEPPSVNTGFDATEDKGGLKVTRVSTTGNVVASGLKVGDIITEVNGKKIRTMVQFYDLIRPLKKDDDITLKVGGKNLTWKLESRPGGGGRPILSIRGSLGLDVEETTTGLKLTNVREGRIAAEGGAKKDDVLLEFAGTKVNTTAKLNELLGDRKEGETVAVKIQRGEETLDQKWKMPGGGDASKRYYNANLFGQAHNVQDMQGEKGYEYGGVYRSDDGGESWKRINSVNPRPMYFSLVRVDPQDDKYLYVGGVSMYRSSDGGKTFTPDASRSVHADQHALWVNPKDGRNLIVGCDGGFYASYDRADNWEHENNMALGLFYHVAVDSRKPYWVYGGLQDNGSWGAPNLVANGEGPINEDWRNLSGGDGFVCRVDWSDPNIVYSESQGGAITRRNLATNENGFIRPRAEQGKSFRFNWNTPYILSNANSKIFYEAGNYVWRSLDRGNNLVRISDEINRTGHGTATALSESPLNPKVLYVGTDDGYLWITTDYGVTWNNITKNVGLPDYFCVSTIEASRFVEGRAYVAFAAHRSNDDKPYVYVTEDFGKTWKPLQGTLPQFGTSRVVREDVINPNLLYCGTEFGLFASLDRGETWSKLGGNLPTVPVHEVAVHPTIGEIAVATHGRSIWIMDVSALRQITRRNVDSDAALYEPNTAIVWKRELGRGTGDGDEKFYGKNPPMGTTIWYSLTKKPKEVRLEIVDALGVTLRRFPNVPAEVGLQKVVFEPFGSSAKPGTYKVILTVDGKTYEKPIRIEMSPELAQNTADPIGGDDDID